jgi:hypothetical protein
MIRLLNKGIHPAVPVRGHLTDIRIIRSIAGRSGVNRESVKSDVEMISPSWPRFDMPLRGLLSNQSPGQFSRIRFNWTRFTAMVVVNEAKGKL